MWRRFQRRQSSTTAQQAQWAGRMFAYTLVCICGATAWFSVNLVGSLIIGEIAALATLPILLFFGWKRCLRRGLPTIFALLGFWLLGQILTDVYRGTVFLDWARGDANILMFGIDIAWMMMLLAGDDRMKTVFITSYALGSMAAARFQPSYDAQMAMWKFGYATGAILLTLMVSSVFFKKKQFSLVVLLLGGITLVNLLENFRSPILFLLITMVLILPIIPERIGRVRLLPPQFTVSRVIVLAAFALFAAVCASQLVDFASSAGLLSEEAKVKNESQSSSPVGTLLTGRPEIFVSAQAVLDSPILGHGSWAKDPKYVEQLFDLEMEWNTSPSPDELEGNSLGLIPAHSYLMGAWVDAGVLGAVFWAYVLFLTPQAIFQLTVIRPYLSPLYAWLLISLLWNIPFSPFGSTSRMITAFTLVVMFDLGDQFSNAKGRLQRLRALSPGYGSWRRGIFVNR